MRNQLKLIELFKRIDYQYIKHLLDSRTDEEKVTDAISVLNGQLDGVGIIDAEMPTSIMGVTVDWSAGTSENDAKVDFALGDLIFQQDLADPSKKITIAQPSNVVATVNALEEQVEISWSAMAGAGGYKIIRDLNTPLQTVILNGSSGYTESGGTLTFADSVGDNASHTYVVIAKGGDNSTSVFSEPAPGKGYGIVSQSINLAGYQATSIIAPASAFEYSLSVSDIAGARGGTGSITAVPGYGGRGMSYVYSSASTAAHTFFFGASAAGAIRYGGAGYNGGGDGGIYGSNSGGGGGGGSVIKIDGTVLCGAAGGGGNYGIGPVSSTTYVWPPGGNGGGIDTLGGGGSGAAVATGVYLGSTNGYQAIISPAMSGSALVNSAFGGGFGSTPNNASANGYILATLTWKE